MLALQAFFDQSYSLWTYCPFDVSPLHWMFRHLDVLPPRRFAP